MKVTAAAVAHISFDTNICHGAFSAPWQKLVLPPFFVYVLLLTKIVKIWKSITEYRWIIDLQGLKKNTIESLIFKNWKRKF